jgi:hypothetical protein
MPKLALRAALFTRYEITDQEAREISILLRAAAQILAPDADEQMSAFITDSGYSRQTVYTWIPRIVFLLLWMLRNLPVGRPSPKMAAHPLWQFIKNATMEPTDAEGA